MESKRRRDHTVGKSCKVHFCGSFWHGSLKMDGNLIVITWIKVQKLKSWTFWGDVQKAARYSGLSGAKRYQD